MGSMSDIDNHHIQALEAAQLTGAAGRSMSYDEIREKAETALYDYSVRLGIEDWSRETSARWAGACSYIGRHAFQCGELWRNPQFRSGDHLGGMYDTEALGVVCDVYIDMCAERSQRVIYFQFTQFTGCSYSIFKDGVRHLRGDWCKKLEAAQEDSVIGLAMCGRGAAVPSVAFLNYNHAWARPRITEDVDSRPLISASDLEALPQFDADSPKVGGSG